MAEQLSLPRGAKRKYTPKQREFFRKLVAEEKCTMEMIRVLTGMPYGSMHALCVEMKVTFALPKNVWGFNTPLARIRRARKLGNLKKKYAAQLVELFP